MRRAAKIDENQAQIVSALRRMGATVASLASVGNGVPDLLVGYRGVNHLMEVKDGAKVPSARKLTPAELEFHAKWRGTVHVVESLGDAMKIIGVTK